jgi:FkbM family methyltransferase
MRADTDRKTRRLFWVPFLSHFLFLLSKLTRSARFMELSADTDPKNIRAALGASAIGKPEYFEQVLLSNLCSFRPIHDATNSAKFVSFCCAPIIFKSHAENFQDMFVIFQTNQKRSGYFVEIGVGDGKSFSNTYLLEKEFQWSGLLIEPNPKFHASIEELRSARLEKRAAYSRSGETLGFLVADIGELSTLAKYQAGGGPKGRLIKVDTINASDALELHSVPTDFDFLSVDTEGSEYDILSVIDFNVYTPKVICVEHNYRPGAKKAYERLLEPFGYVSVFEHLSGVDAWFIRAIAERLRS